MFVNSSDVFPHFYLQFRIKFVDLFSFFFLVSQFKHNVLSFFFFHMYFLLLNNMRSSWRKKKSIFLKLKLKYENLSVFIYPRNVKLQDHDLMWGNAKKKKFYF